MNIKNILAKKIPFFLLFFLITFFIYGFLVGENSAGAGGYNGDLLATFTNLQLFINNNILQSIKLTADNNLYYSNRPPLLYILHSALNPFASDLELYRLSVFIASFLVPLFFYLSLKINYKKVNDIFLLCLSFLILLSPYFRTSSYWGLEENYPFITLLLSFIFLKKFFFKVNFLNFFLSIFFSAICVYFDQKFIIIPLTCFFLIIFSKIHIKYKVYSILLYFVFSLPFIYLIQLWGNIIPVGNMDIYSVGKRFYPHHICYIVNILGFYILPFLFLFKENKIKEIFFSIYKKKINILLILAGLSYVIYFIFYLDITSSFTFGGGYSLKIAVFLFNSILAQKFFLALIFIFCFIIILIFININYINTIFITYFLLSSVIINPLLHEYVDPLLLFFFFTISKSKININLKNIFLIFFYFLTILITAKIYY